MITIECTFLFYTQPRILARNWIIFIQISYNPKWGVGSEKQH
jgi:hypothetical protein